MRSLLRLSSLLFPLVAILWWISDGARIGWWQTRVGVEHTDEITGLRVIEWQERFAPGVETPALGLLVGSGLFAGAFLFRPKLPTKQKST